MGFPLRPMRMDGLTTSAADTQQSGRLADGGGFLVNPTREFVIPGGAPVPDSSLLLRLGDGGNIILTRRF